MNQKIKVVAATGKDLFLPIERISEIPLFGFQLDFLVKARYFALSKRINLNSFSEFDKTQELAKDALFELFNSCNGVLFSYFALCISGERDRYCQNNYQYVSIDILNTSLCLMSSDINIFGVHIRKYPYILEYYIRNKDEETN